MIMAEKEKMSYEDVKRKYKKEGRVKYTSEEYYDRLGFLMGCTLTMLESIKADDDADACIKIMADILSQGSKGTLTITQLIKLMDYVARTEDRERNAQYRAEEFQLRAEEFQLRKDMIKKPELTQSIEDLNDVPLGLLERIEEITDEYYGVPKEKPDLSKYTRKKAVDRSDQESET